MEPIVKYHRVVRSDKLGLIVDAGFTTPELAMAQGKYDAIVHIEYDPQTLDLSDVWRNAVLDQMALCAMDLPVETPPSDIIRKVLDWHVAVATDPAVNGGFKLVKVCDVTPNTELSDELRKLGFELEGVLADIDHEGLQAFDAVCEQTVERVRLRLAVLSSQLRAASPAPLREAGEPVAWAVKGADGKLLISENRTLLSYFDNPPRALVWAGIEAGGDGGEGRKLIALIERYGDACGEVVAEQISYPGDSWQNKQPAVDALMAEIKALLSPTSPPNGKTEGDADGVPPSAPAMPPRLLQSLARRNFRAPTDMDDLIAMAANIIAEDGFVIERLQAKLADGVTVPAHEVKP